MVLPLYLKKAICGWDWICSMMDGAQFQIYRILRRKTVTIAELFDKGGVAMWPLAFLSILALATIVERFWFWMSILSREQQIVDRVLDASSAGQWEQAIKVARQERHKPIGRFLYAPLKRNQPDPETFKLALESAAENELTTMRRGEKTLQAIIALAPLLGLLGTVLGLIRSLSGIKLTDLANGSGTGVTLGISESLISTATGMIVAITSVAFYWFFQGLLFKQVGLFRKAGNELEILYRERYNRGGGKITHHDEETELL
jgi:biopolymer transport protein ExbB